MSTRRPRAAVVVLGLAVFAAVGACRAPTQAELLIGTTAQCAELGEVAIVVGADPASAEARADTGFYAAQTTDCEPASRSIGSLVVTPGGARAAVLVIAPPKGTPVGDCRPPRYAGCIVSRRAFAFIDNVSLRIPVSLDVECRDVPCDAFSTCRKGSCYPADVACNDDGECRGIGELADGGVSPEASVVIDGSPPNDAAAGSDAAADSGGDAGNDGAAPDAGVDAAREGGPVAQDAAVLEAGAIPGGG